MYKSILVHVDQTASAARRIDLAARLALKYDAHLIGTAMTGMSPYVFPIGGFDMAVPPLPYEIDDLRAEADRALDAFDARARSAGVASFERRRIDEVPGIGLSMQSRYCDLVVIGQFSQAALVPSMRSDFPEYVLLNCIAPVLVVPASGTTTELGRKVTVAWNGGPNAARAIMSAIPLLRQAERVDLVVYNAQFEGDLHGEQPGADMALYLARHGIKVEVAARDASANAGNALLTHAAEQGSDMIVMGAFGHSRFREIVFGGVTRTALTSTPLPLWMAH